MHILFTRSEFYTKNLSDKFNQLGHLVTNFPILQVIKLSHKKINFEKYSSIIFTSANAVINLDQSFLPEIKCYCVGELTAEYVKKKGFKNVIAAGGNYYQLKKTILNLENNNNKFLYLRGEFISHNLEKDLIQHGLQIDSCINYSTILSRNFDNKTKKNLKNELIDIIFLYSKKSAEHFLALIRNNNLVPQCTNIRLRCLSENVSEPLKKVQWKEIKLFRPGNEEFCLD